jgi:hypothetical protein
MGGETNFEKKVGLNQNLVVVCPNDPEYKNFVTGISQVFVKKSNKIGRL